MESGDLICQVGRALYGPRWETALARDLSVSNRTVRHWLSGFQEPPAGVWLDLLRLVRARGQQTARVAIELVGRIGVAYAHVD